MGSSVVAPPLLAQIDPTPEGSGEAAPPAAEPTPADAIDVSLQTLGEQLRTAATGDFDAILGLTLSYAVPAMLLLLALLAAYFVGKFLSRLVSKPISDRVDVTLGRFLGKLVFWIVMVGSILGVLGAFGLNIASFAAVIAAAGFAVGLAFQGTLSNFAAGIMLLVFRPFKVGDVVTAAGLTAKINEIDLFFTRFDTFDNRHIIVPNSEVFNNTIENATFYPDRRIDLNVGVSYDADIDKTREVLEAAVRSVDGLIEGENRGLQIYLMDMGDSAIKWIVRAWHPTADYWLKRELLVRAVKQHLDKADINIPYPQMDVHLADKRAA